jgi:hypothetical protein
MKYGSRKRTRRRWKGGNPEAAGVGMGAEGEREEDIAPDEDVAPEEYMGAAPDACLFFVLYYRRE